MLGLLLSVIYLAFISLGLPDSLLGSAWPTIHIDLNVSLSSMGIITMIISGCTIISSLFSDKLNRKLGTWTITVVSIVLTALALLGFSFADNFVLLCLLAIPYGLGAGSIDAALNNFVALHFSSKHMSWLHCFWGIGTIISPYIMSFCLNQNHSWHQGYLIVSLIQIAIAIIVGVSLPLWKKTKTIEQEEVIPSKLSFKEKISIKGVVFVLISFFCYCAIESTAMNWASTYFYEGCRMDEVLASALGSLFFIGMTIGRLLSGFITNRLGDNKMIRLGSFVIFIAIILLFIPWTNNAFLIGAFIILGIGCGPIYPAIIHSTPTNFKKENSQGIIGLEMACAYLGTTFMPPLFGLIANHISVKLLPVFILIFFVLFILFFNLLLKKLKDN